MLMYIVKARRTGGCTVITCPYMTVGDYYDVSIDEDGVVTCKPVGHVIQEVEE